MKRIVPVLATALLGCGLAAGCNSANQYTPQAEPTVLSAYAAQAKFPMNTEPKENAKLTAVVENNGMLTVRNFMDAPLSNFNLWINQAYVLHVDTIPPNGARTFSRDDFFNSQGTMLSAMDPSGIKKVQVVTSAGDVMNVQGPQMSQ